MRTSPQDFHLFFWSRGAKIHLEILLFLFLLSIFAFFSCKEERQHQGAEVGVVIHLHLLTSVCLFYLFILYCYYY